MTGMEIILATIVSLYAINSGAAWWKIVLGFIVAVDVIIVLAFG